MQRAQTATLFLSDAGVFRRVQLLSYPESELQWSLYYAAGSPTAAGLLLMLHVAAAVAMLLGWWTRVATCACWVGWASVSQRAGVLASEADTLLRLALLWGCFLPVRAGACARRKIRQPAERLRVLSVGRAAWRPLLVRPAVRPPRRRVAT